MPSMEKETQQCMAVLQGTLDILILRWAAAEEN
jgi:hypothetical protein